MYVLCVFHLLFDASKKRIHFDYSKLINNIFGFINERPVNITSKQLLGNRV
jgi:hypothetical protein